MEYIVLNLDEVTEEQLDATISCNIRTARLMRSKIDNLKKVAANVQKEAKQPLIEEEKTVVESEQSDLGVDQDFENEVEYYCSQVKELTLDNIDEEIEDALPSRKNYQYERILNRLKLESIRTIKDIKDLLSEEGLSSEDIESFKEELELELKKIELINQYLSPEKQAKQEQTQKENNLIFVPTQGGNIRVLEELDSIPVEYYSRINSLFQSIKDGTFKKVKRFGNSELTGLCEVKDYQVRVCFVRLDKESYAVLSTFVKKTDNDKAYRSTLYKRYVDYQLIEDKLRENLSNSEFMQIHKDYETELFNKLTPVALKNLPITKKKGGEA